MLRGDGLYYVRDVDTPYQRTLTNVNARDAVQEPSLSVPDVVEGQGGVRTRRRRRSRAAQCRPRKVTTRFLTKGIAPTQLETETGSTSPPNELLLAKLER